jgi:hypothetical protein
MLQLIFRADYKGETHHEKINFNLNVINLYLWESFRQCA